MKRITWTALLVALMGGVGYVMAVQALTPAIQRLYKNDPTVIYAPSHFADARQYVLICMQGYNVPGGLPGYPPLPTLASSRLSWMPVYPLLQCALHKFGGVSLIFAGPVLAIGAMLCALFFAVLTLHNLGVPHPAISALAVLIPSVGAVWIYLPGPEASFLAVGMIALWLITLPAPAHPAQAAVRYALCLPLGVLYVLLKPNALMMFFALCFAFVYVSWQNSRRVGYTFGLWTFAADLLLAQVRPRMVRLQSARPICYAWTPLIIAAGTILGFAFWLAYCSVLSGVPFYFLNLQYNYWAHIYSAGNVREIIQFFAQAFQPSDPTNGWQRDAAWALAAYLVALLPATSKRVPSLIRVMIVLMVGTLVVSGVARYAVDRYLASTAIVAIGWACWLAPAAARKRYAVMRWLFALALFGVTWVLLVDYLMPLGEPTFWHLHLDSNHVPW